jgi:hypothetical protein
VSITAESVWPSIEALIAARDPNALALAIDELDDDHRRVVATALRAYTRPNRNEPHRRYSEEHLLAIVGAGVLPDAKTVGTWLARHSSSYYTEGASEWERHQRKDVVPQILFVLTRRSVTWLPALVTELARRMVKDSRYYWTGERFDLVNRLLGVTGQEPPTGDGFVVGWVVRNNTRDTLVAALEADPRLSALVPRMFELDEVGAVLDGSEHWPLTLAELASLGLVDRDVLLDACVARLGRAGKPGATRAYAKVLEALEPTATEIAARVTGYASMVSASLSTVAAMAQQALFDLDDAGAVPLDVVLSSSRAALGRSEKKIVRAQLSRFATADASRAEPIARLIIDALPDLAPDLARAALTPLRKLASDLTVDQRADLFAAAKPLSNDLATDLSRTLGVDASATPIKAVPALSQPWRPNRLDSITGLGELAAETTVLFDWSVELDPGRFERVLEGLIHWTRVDSAALRQALRPTIDSERFRQAGTYYEYSYNHTFSRGFMAVIAAAAGEPPVPHYTDTDRPHSAGDVVVDRLFALDDALRNLAPGPAISRPTWDNGLIEPSDLLGRLTRAAGDSIEPWDIELEQALLRLSIPNESGERRDLADAFAALGTAAGRTTATWVSVRLPADPLLTTVAVPRHQTNYEGSVTREWEQVVVSVQPAAQPEPASVVWAGLTKLDPGQPGGGGSYTGAQMCIPWLAPRHRDLIAAHLLQGFESWHNNRIITLPLLPALATLDGTFGDATALALVYGYAADRSDAREHAVQATITMCARQILDPGVLGRILADVVVRRTVVTTRLAAPLREVAVGGGAQTMWDVLRVALPALLRPQPSLAGLVDILGLAADVAAQVDAHDAVDGLDEFASRPGSSRQLIEARRLRQVVSH